MTAALVLPSYLEPYVQRLYDAHHKELRGLNSEAVRLAVAEALGVVCASEDEIDTVTYKLRAKLRDDALPPQLLGRDDADDDLFR